MIEGRRIVLKVGYNQHGSAAKWDDWDVRTKTRIIICIITLAWPLPGTEWKLNRLFQTRWQILHNSFGFLCNSLTFIFCYLCRPSYIILYVHLNVSWIGWRKEKVQFIILHQQLFFSYVCENFLPNNDFVQSRIWLFYILETFPEGFYGTQWWVTM